METQATCGDVLEIYGLYRHNLPVGTLARYMGNLKFVYYLKL